MCVCVCNIPRGSDVIYMRCPHPGDIRGRQNKCRFSFMIDYRLLPSRQRDRERTVRRRPSEVSADATVCSDAFMNDDLPPDRFGLNGEMWLELEQEGNLRGKEGEERHLVAERHKTTRGEGEAHIRLQSFFSVREKQDARKPEKRNICDMRRYEGTLPPSHQCGGQLLSWYHRRGL